MIRVDPPGPEDFSADLDLNIHPFSGPAVEETDGPGAAGQTGDTVARRFWGRGRAVLVTVIVAFFVTAVGLFLSFAHQVSAFKVPSDPRADAIVVLTGGKERISKAMRLLEEGRAGRLLISGVHPGSSARQIAKATSSDFPLFSCCVDLDRAALNTFGNATETALWVQKHQFKTLMVVTSAYHLPRAQLELADALPDVELVAYPVFAAERDLSAWYESFDTMKLLMREYVKYTLARLRIATDHLIG